MFDFCCYTHCVLRCLIFAATLCLTFLLQSICSLSVGDRRSALSLLRPSDLFSFCWRRSDLFFWVVFVNGPIISRPLNPTFARRFPVDSDRRSQQKENITYIVKEGSSFPWLRASRASRHPPSVHPSFFPSLTSPSSLAPFFVSLIYLYFFNFFFGQPRDWPTQYV
jgi:hypothetical protein